MQPRHGSELPFVARGRVVARRRGSAPFEGVPEADLAFAAKSDVPRTAAQIVLMAEGMGFEPTVEVDPLQRFRANRTLLGTAVACVAEEARSI